MKKFLGIVGVLMVLVIGVADSALANGVGVGMPTIDAGGGDEYKCECGNL